MAQENVMHNLLQDMNILLNISLGEAQLSLKEICEMKPGFAFKLNKFAGEPLDIYANDTSIAKCEPVVIDETFGVRIVELNRRTEPETKNGENCHE